MSIKKTGILLLFIAGTGFAQVESFKINKEAFFKPTINSMGYLIANVDSVVWNDALFPLGFTSVPTPQKVNALEYKKTTTGYYQYIGFDERFWVLTVIWKDESGKNSLAAELKKSLKGKEHTTPGTFKIQLNGNDMIIGIESNKDKALHEMITIEVERK